MPDISGVICWLTDSLILAQQVLYVAVSILIRLEGISCFGEVISHNNNNYKNTTGTVGFIDQEKSRSWLLHTPEAKKPGECLRQRMFTEEAP